MIDELRHSFKVERQDKKRLSWVMRIMFFFVILTLSAISFSIIAVYQGQVADFNKIEAENNEKRANVERDKAQELNLDLRTSERRLGRAMNIGFSVIEARYSGDSNELRESIAEVREQLEPDRETQQTQARLHLFEAIFHLVQLQSNMNGNELGGNLLQARVNLQQANTLLDNSIKCDPQLGLAYMVRAQLWSEAYPKIQSLKLLLQTAGTSVPSAEDIAKDWSKAVTLMPQSTYAFSGRGWWFLRRGVLASAADDLKEALRLEPENDFAMQGLAELLYKQGHYHECVDMLINTVRTSNSMRDVLFKSTSKEYLNEKIAVITFNKLWNKSKLDLNDVRPAAVVHVFGKNVPELEVVRGVLWKIVLKEIHKKLNVDWQRLAEELRKIDFPEGNNTYQNTRRLLLAFALAGQGDAPPNEIAKLLGFPLDEQTKAGTELEKSQLESLKENAKRHLGENPEAQQQVIGKINLILSSLQQ
ncbi:hypothetical protein [uncultured Gimesia sp.]|uniref:tetratricopeptide repeat protein n=1 Tax=uncultured Gimesia sp. TaxID=1678688 RepID=UPI0026165DFE|nr:hypothetical protein [uncultured Gimesia sp.]